MAENELIVTAGLNFEASEALIVKQLETIQNNFNNKGGLQINCTINDAAIKQLQTNLESISKNLTLAIDSGALQQSINNATKNQSVRVNVSADIKKGEILKQAKEIEESFRLAFPQDAAKSLRAELREILTDFDKAFKTSNATEMQNNLERLTDLCWQYDSGLDEVTQSMREQEAELKKLARANIVYISEAQKEELSGRYGNGLQSYLQSILGIGKFTYDRSKATTTWDDLSSQLNEKLNSSLFNVNAAYYDDVARINTSDIVKGLEQYADIITGSMRTANSALQSNSATWEQWSDMAYNALMKFHGQESIQEGIFYEFDDAQINHTEQNIQAVAKGMETIAALKASLKANDPNGITGITADWTQDAERNLNGFVLNVQKVNGEVEHLYYELNETGDAFEQFKIKGSDSGVEKMLVKANNAANALERRIISLKSAADDASAPRPITSEESIQKVADAYNNAETAIQKLRTADASTFQELDNEAKIAVEELNNVIKAARNADTAATKLRAKPIEIIKAEETSKLNEFVTTISNSAVPSVENLIQKVDVLRTELGEVKDKQGLTDYLNKLTTLEADFKALETQAKAVKKAISDLDKLAGSTQFKNNVGNQDVTTQVSKITALRNEYNALLNALSRANTPESIQIISNKLAELKPQFDAVVQSSTELNNSLKDSDVSAKFAAKLNQLKNQVEIFANTNRRATESLRVMRDGETTFARGFQNIRDALSRENLDATGLQRLKEQFQNFRGEADATGLTVSRFFQSMQSQLRMVLQRWISLYAVIGYIRKMIDNVKELDNAMIDLRRVTDETDAGYQRFLEDANKLARQMKTTTASLVEMSYQWSKLGFEMNEALELSKASTIFMRVADVGQDQALSNLVTSLKAFRLEASQTMDVVDKLDKLNNEYAVSAAGLGEGLERSASAMAMSGNTLEETLAMLTGAGEITQNLENTGKHKCP